MNELMQRRDFVHAAIVGVGLSLAQPVFANEEPKKDEPKKPEPKKEEAKKEEPKKPEPKKEEPKKPELRKQIDLADVRDEGYNNDLLKQIENMRDKRDEMSVKILKYEEDAAKLRKEIESRNSRLSKLENLIATRTKYRAELDKDITEAEAELYKILETSAGLLDKLKSKTR